MKNNSILLTALFTAVLATPAAATTIYSYGINSQPPQAGAIMSGVAVAAVSFSLSSAATLRAVTFHTLECCGSTWSGTISYYLFQNWGNTPDNVAFAQGSTTTFTRQQVYTDGLNMVNAYTFNIATPQALAANTVYWLGLKLNGGPNSPSWSFGVPYSGISVVSPTGSFNSWSLQQGQGAFSLSDVANIPEPATAWMMLSGAGLVALGAWKRRSSR